MLRLPLAHLLAGCLMATSGLAFEFHGSGTTHTAKCFYSIFEELQARSKSHVQLTYRSVGSSTGLTEFKNNFDPQGPAVDFAAGEIPITAEDYQTFTDMNVSILHLPTLFGAVSFFHSIPETPNLNLTSCLLARIFTRDIKDWTHPDILEENAGLAKSFQESTANGDSLGASLRIRVARRTLGSSAALSITEYLHKACPRYFPATMVGSLPDWPIDTEACKGTLGMIDCIKGRAGTIGFMDTGSGVAAGLPEISIRNKFGRLLTAQEAIAHQGVGAIEQGVLPEDPRADFSSVSLLDQDGEWTWPITLLTYIYIRQDLSFMADPDSQSLLVAFLKTLYDPDYVTQCNTKHELTLASGASLKLGLDGVKLLEASLPNTSHTWTFEGTAEAILGGLRNFFKS